MFSTKELKIKKITKTHKYGNKYSQHGLQECTETHYLHLEPDWPRLKVNIQVSLDHTSKLSKNTV